MKATFAPASPRTLALIRAFNVEQRCTFLTSSNYMHRETAKLGLLLSDLLAGEGKSGICRTFFVNSRLEAFSGAIKLARQTSVRKRRADEGWILVVDRHSSYQPFLEPTGRGVAEGMTPHVRSVATVQEARAEVRRRAWSAVIHVRYPGDGAREELSLLMTEVRQSGALVVACAAELELGPELFQHGCAPDVVVFGENLTDRQVPFGCFTMTEAAHQVWNNDVDCFAQTSTFGGNQLCAALALQALAGAGLVSDTQRRTFAQIDRNFATCIEYWGKHVNPGMAKLGGVFGMDIDVARAAGGRFWTADGRQIIDCSGGFGSNLRGHNPEDVREALDSHDASRDYFMEFENLLRQLTPFQHAFPAVSGATAVDLAATLALLANPTRRKVVTFSGNFSGKTLFSLNFSKQGPQLTESDPDAFRPYYAGLVYIDPFAEGAEAELRRVLRGGDVALVWFELVRGGMCERLPAKLIATIDELKSECGYLVGVDEVLTGGWRTGESYLAHAGAVQSCDIVTVGKTLSDMTLPMAAVLVRDEVLRRAQAANAAHVQRLRSVYRNSLTAHLAERALSRVAGERERFLANQRLIREGLERIASSSKVLSEVRGSGAMLLFVMNPRYFPFHHRSKLGNLLEMALSHLIFMRCGVFAFLLRFLHRVSTSEEDARELVARLEHGMRDVTPAMVYRYAASRVLASGAPWLSALLGRGTTEVARGPLPFGEHSALKGATE